MTSSYSTPLELRAALAQGGDVETLRDLIEEVDDAVLIADRHGRYVAVNRAALRLTGFGKRELLKKALPDLTGSSDAVVSEVLWRAFLDQGLQTGTFAIRRKDGSTIRVHYEALANVIPGYHASFLRPTAD